MSFYNYYVQYKFFYSISLQFQIVTFVVNFCLQSNLLKKFCKQATVEFTDVGRHF